MPYDSLKIAGAIQKAVEAAQVHVNDDDGGTCNFDAAYLRVPRMTEQQAKEIERLSGTNVYIMQSEWFGRILMITGGLSGQGMRRTRMAETMTKSLQESGLEANTWFQMD